MNHQGLCWNVYCVVNVGLRKRLNPNKRGFKIHDLLVLTENITDYYFAQAKLSDMFNFEFVTDTVN